MPDLRLGRARASAPLRGSPHERVDADEDDYPFPSSVPSPFALTPSRSAPIVSGGRKGPVGASGDDDFRLSPGDVLSQTRDAGGGPAICQWTDAGRRLAVTPPA